MPEETQIAVRALRHEAASDALADVVSFGRGARIRSHVSYLNFVSRLADGVLIAVCLWVLATLYGTSWGPYYGLATGCGVAAFYFIAESRGLYRSWRTGSLRGEIAETVQVWLVVVAVCLLGAFVFKVSTDYSRTVILGWFAATPLALGSWRCVARYIAHRSREQGLNVRTAVIAGAGDLGLRLARGLVESPWMGIRISGFYDDGKSRSRVIDRHQRWTVIGNLDQLVADVRARAADIVFIVLPMRAQRRIEQLIAELADTTATVYLVPDVFMSDLMSARWINVRGIPAVGVYETPFAGTNRVLKRAEDLVLGALLTLVGLLPMVPIALAVRLSSPGPVLFKQRRYGIDGKIVWVWKFRTMTVVEDGAVAQQATRNDARVTSVGAFLRKTSLDELPQLFNVLGGSMSLVGPRPHPIALNEQYRGLIRGYMLRHMVKPGMTGWAQVNGWRGETEGVEQMRGRVMHDLEYIQNWSLWLDVKILWRTMFVVLGDKKAY
jgi:putative colanic acid biosynthesis UDP-glucose lipid carrier transferase